MEKEIKYVFIGNAQLKTRDFINQLQEQNKQLQDKLDLIHSWSDTLPCSILSIRVYKLFNEIIESESGNTK